MNGPTLNNNSPIDYDGTFNMEGGFMIAAGSSALADSMRNATGMTAPALINLGLAGVGLRAAVGT